MKGRDRRRRAKRLKQQLKGGQRTDHVPQNRTDEIERLFQRLQHR